MRKRNAKLFFLLSLSLFLVGMILYWQSGIYSTFRVEDRDFSVDKDLEITRIEMESLSEGKKIVLHKDKQEKWRLDSSLFANDLAVRELIVLLERLSVRQPVSIANRNQVEEMLSATGVLVDVFVAAHRVNFGNFRLFPYERRFQSFIVGPDAPEGESTFMRKTSSDQAFRVTRPGYKKGVSELFTAEKRVWRDPIVFDVSHESIHFVDVSVYGNEEESFVLKPLNDQDFQFFRDEDKEKVIAIEADTTRVLRFLSSFRDIHYERLLDEEDEKIRKELMFEQPFMEISVKTKDGMQTNIKAFARHATDEILSIAEGVSQDPNRLYVQVNEGEYALAQYYVFSRILRPLSFFENKPAEPSSD